MRVKTCCRYASLLCVVLISCGLTAQSSPVDGNFRYDGVLGGYVFNLSTHGLATGTYRLNFVVDADPVPHAVMFQVK